MFMAALKKSKVKPKTKPKFKPKKQIKKKNKKKSRLSLDTEKLIIVAVIIAIVVFAIVFAVNPFGVTAQFQLAAKMPLTSMTVDGPLAINPVWIDIYDYSGKQIEHSNVRATHIQDLTNTSKLEINGFKTSDIYLVKGSATGYETYYKDVDDKVKFCCVLFL